MAPIVETVPFDLVLAAADAEAEAPPPAFPAFATDAALPAFPAFATDADAPLFALPAGADEDTPPPAFGAGAPLGCELVELESDTTLNLATRCVGLRLTGKFALT